MMNVFFMVLLLSDPVLCKKYAKAPACRPGGRGPILS